ncbi:MAG: sugar ABC transporter permease [Anaerolineae bacterium]|nr:sugar ABC transporter permease [Anaerolineae bacterium]
MSASPATRPGPLARVARFWQRNKWSYFFIAPSMILFSVFIFFPVIQAFLFAFQKVDLRGSSWVGLKNFTDLASSKLFWASMRHTVIYAFFVVVAWISSSLAVAALIQPLANRAQALFRGAFYLPNVISIIVISLVWIWIFHPEFGFFNYLLGLFGLGPVLWLQNPDIALWAIVLSTVLIVPGTGVVLYSAAIGAIPPELYEAAEVEGASAFRKWVSITIPLLKPTTLYLMVIYTIAGFQIFERVYIMTGGGPINSTMTIVQLIYQTAFSDFNYGRASAEALILFAIIATASIIQFKFLSTDIEY